MTPEVWKPVKGFEERYEVSNHGRIMRKDQDRVLGHTYNYSGQPAIVLCNGSKRRVFTVARLVALTFLGEHPTLSKVANKDGDPTNNHVENLVWVKSTERPRRNEPR